jgi:hypothetical protein
MSSLDKTIFVTEPSISTMIKMKGIHMSMSIVHVAPECFRGRARCHSYSKSATRTQKQLSVVNVLCVCVFEVAGYPTIGSR